MERLVELEKYLEVFRKGDSEQLCITDFVDSDTAGVLLGYVILIVFDARCGVAGSDWAVGKGGGSMDIRALWMQPEV